MKKRLLTLGVIMATVLLVFSSSYLVSSPDGAPSGVSNDPSSGSANCTNCHSGTATIPATTVANITTNIPAAGYTPGVTYTITATVNYAGRTRFGFQVSPQNAAGTKLGTLINTGNQTKLVGSGKYVTQTQAGNSGTGTKTWTFNWVAPVAGTGTVTFYGSLMAANNNGGTSGDATYKVQTSVTESSPCSLTVSISSPDTICPLDTVTLVASSNQSNATYLWNTGSNTQVAIGGSGTFTVTASAGGCTATATKTVVARAIKAPTGFFITNIKGTSATINWVKSSCATGYKIQYRPLGTVTWKTSTIPVDTSNKTLFALTPTTLYEYQVATTVGNVTSTWGTLKTFTTACLCNPETPVVSNTASTNKTFNWTDDACGVRYKLQYRKSTVTAWTTRIVGDTSLTTTITGLSLNTAYNYQFRRECNTTGTYSSTWVTGTFTTPVAGVEPITLIRMTDLFGREVDGNYKDMVIYHYSDGTAKKGFIVK